MKLVLYVGLLLFSFPQLISAQFTTPEMLMQAAKKMSIGHFSNANQAEKEGHTIFEHHMHTVAIWEDKEVEGDWFYMEILLAENQEQPILHLVFQHKYIEEGKFERILYGIREHKAHYGAWKEEAPLANLSMDDLVGYPNCPIVFEAKNHHKLVGASPTQGCTKYKPNPRVYHFAYTLTPHYIESFPREFNLRKQQIWGNQIPFIFERIQTAN